MTTVRFSKDFNGGGVFYVPGLSYEQSQWFGARGWFWFGRKSAPELAGKLRAAGVPENCRWLPGSKAEVAAEVFGAEGVCFDPGAAERVQAKAEALTASRAVDADIELPAPAGLAYRPYQRGGVAFALAALERGQKGVIFGDEMGLGKTMQAIGVLAVTRPTRTLVVCPASLRINWTREISKWVPELADQIALVNEAADLERGAVVVLNFDKVAGPSARAKALRAALESMSWDLLIIDEAHYLKNPKSQRTCVFFGKWNRGKLESEGVVHRSARVLQLTGTPVQNKVAECIPLVRALGAFEKGAAFPSEFSFLKRYCGAAQVWTGRKHVWTFNGATNLPELQSKLRAGYMVRRLKSEVAPELPPKLRTLFSLPYEGELRIDVGGEIEPKSNENFESAVLRLVGQTMSFQELSAYRARLAREKAPVVVEHVRGLLEEDAERKVLVFAHHTDVLNALESELAEFGTIRIDGSTAPESRQALVDTFQGTPSVRVAILSTHAAGVGLTLTAANVVVFGEADWNPSWCVQAEDRAHRIGQEAESVTVHYLTLDGTLDAHVLRTMVTKMDVADRALDRQTETKALPPAPVAALPEHASEATEVEIKGRNDREPQKFMITPERRLAAREALLYLSSVCDGAHERDGSGFNGRDASSSFVQDLVAQAQAGNLTARQTAWALRILQTYRDTQLAHMRDRLFPECQKAS